jgi:uncharacterized protein
MPTKLEIVKACFTAFQRGDIDAIQKMSDENVEWIEPGDPAAIPFAGHGKTKYSQAEFFRIVGETSDMLKFEPQQYVTSGNHVVALGFWELRVKATEKVVRSDWAVDFTVQNGKVTRWQAYYDTAATAAAFAAVAQAV